MKSTKQLKQDVALHLQKELSSQKLLLFGSGSTVNTIIQNLQNEPIECVASSTATSLTLQAHGLPEVQLDQIRNRPNRICVDGADLVLTTSHHIIKGHGGALVREKITWKAATQVIVVIDESKLSDIITTTIPIAVIPFGLSRTMDVLAELSDVSDVVIHHRGGLPFRSDDGLMIVHLTVDEKTDLVQLDSSLQEITGVVETGIFLPDEYPEIRFVCGTQSGVREL